MKNRVFVFAIVMAAVLVVPTPARSDARAWSSPIWWSALTGGPLGLTSDGRGAVVTTDAGEVRALSFDGTTQWVAMVDRAQDGYPAVSKDLVLVGAAGRAVALGRRDGTVRWEQPTDGQVLAVALAGGYALVGDTGGTLRAFTARGGALAWSAHWEGELSSPPQVDVAASVVVAIWNQLPAPAARGLDLATGTLRWEQPVGLYTAAPGLDHGRAVVATGDGHFHAWVASIDVASGPGPDTWWFELPRSFETGVLPAVDAHDLVVVDRAGRVTAFDPVSGALRWTRPLNVRVIDTRVVLLARRVVITALVGQVFVLDRAGGRVVAHADSRDFDGTPLLAAPARRFDRMLVALRRSGPGTVEMHRVP